MRKVVIEGEGFWELFLYDIGKVMEECVFVFCVLGIGQFCEEGEFKTKC